jgi:hypothetical protein
VDPEADVQPVLAHLAFVELDADLATSAAMTGGPRLRSLDAIHLASALRIGADLEAFVTYDVRQAEAARTAGLTVLTPHTRESLDALASERSGPSAPPGQTAASDSGAPHDEAGSAG